MKPKAKLKIAIDLLMTLLLLTLMAYSLVGETAHEWLGVSMFVLFITHHCLNVRWSKSVLKGKYTPYRILQTVLVGLICCTMLGSCIGALILSKRVFTFLPIDGGRTFARVLHMLSAYWGFVLMSLHLGLHWSTMIGMARKIVKLTKVQTMAIRIASCAIAVYGIYAFILRDIGSYMLLKTQFVFFNFDEPLFYFFVDYFAVMWLYVSLAYVLAQWLRKPRRGKTMPEA